MIRLCIDTSIGTSVAVVEDDVVRSDLNGHDTMRHAEVIGGLIREALAHAGVTSGDVEAVVAGLGPGPFTGLRVGLAAASAFSVGAGVPLQPVVSHDAIAAEAGHDLFEDEVEFIVTTDARRREIAWSRYIVLEPLSQPAGRFVRAEGPALTLASEPVFAHLPRVDGTLVSAGWLGRVAHSMLSRGLDLPPFEPLYLRSPDVTLASAPKRVSS